MTTTVSFTVATADGPRPVRVAYERTGSGEPLLLLHGIGHHLRAWDPVTRILAAEREVIAIDLPGFGTSPALPDGVPYDLATVGRYSEPSVPSSAWTARMWPGTCSGACWRWNWAAPSWCVR
nr:alpha/beta fold hydrolase [Streptomyces anulatus]